MESRLLLGKQKSFERMQEITSAAHIWPSKDFFEAKWKEQITRHHKFHDTAYNLEPNVKESPGGLRDIQMIGWVAKRHFDADTLHELVTHNFLTESEFNDLWQGQLFIWKIRFALHIITGRREDRLLFDHQRTLAKQFGYKDDEQHLAVEKFMKQYYRTVMELNRLNEMLLQLFQEEILYPEEAAPFAIHERFQVRKGFLEVKHNNVFKDAPVALLEMFLVMEQHQEIKGVRANTIRLVRQHTHLIDDDFRNSEIAKKLFIDFFKAKHGVTHELRRMNRYGVLAAYLPEFENIVGQMQHDLFHVYTVDEHTTVLIRNLRRFTVPEFSHEFPLASSIIQKMNDAYVLYIAALYHDIAKGRGGDHSVLGAVDAENFCLRHGLPEKDSRLIVWLVKNHLLMSQISQRKDIGDPEVINEFAILMDDKRHLDSLYLLTVADIRATSPNVWNSWKDALLSELYRSTTKALKRGLDRLQGEDELISKKKEAALQQVEHFHINKERLLDLWSQLDTEYFIHYSPDEYLWHAMEILNHNSDAPLVRIRQQTQRGGTEVFIYTPSRDNLFVITTRVLEKTGLTVADAKLLQTNLGCSLNTFIMLEENGEAISDYHRIQEIQDGLEHALTDENLDTRIYAGQVKRQLKLFPVRTALRFIQGSDHSNTVMELTASDRPGLLANIAEVFLQLGIRISNAKITTLGERVEDVFVITDKQGQAITNAEQLKEIEKAIIQRLDS
jgi:[protein-PII] uridylyltransferase